MTALAKAPTPLARLDERALLGRWQRDGDEHAREELVRRYLPLARRLARRYAREHDSVEDLTQAATVGLIQAIDRFQLERGNSLGSYVFPTMSGELKRYIRDTRWWAHVPRALQERTLAARQATDRLAAAGEPAPTLARIGEELALSEEEVTEALLAGGARDVCSLDAPARDSDDGPGEEWLGALDADLERVEDVSAVDWALRALPPRERHIVRLRFRDELSQSQIAERIGVSQMQVSRLLRRALGRIRILVGHEPGHTLERTGAC